MSSSLIRSVSVQPNGGVVIDLIDSSDDEMDNSIDLDIKSDPDRDSDLDASGSESESEIEQVWEVLSIISERPSRTIPNSKEFLVQWVEHQPTWQPESDLYQCQDALAEYYARINAPHEAYARAVLKSE